MSPTPHTSLLLTAVLALGLVVPAFADDPAPPPPPPSKITVKLTGLCTGDIELNSWSFGANQTSSGFSSGAGAGAGKVQVRDFVLTKTFDACSPKLFGAVASGQRISTVVITQTDSTGKKGVTTITLSGVLVTSWTIGGNPDLAEPTEQISLSAQQITIKDPESGQSAGWDVVKNAKI